MRLCRTIPATVSGDAISLAAPVWSASRCTLTPCSDRAFAAFLDHMYLFKLGYSWGGYESLMVPTYPATLRSSKRWEAPGPSVRIHVGLENVDDLIRDLERGLERLRTTA